MYTIQDINGITTQENWNNDEKRTMEEEAKSLFIGNLVSIRDLKYIVISKELEVSSSAFSGFQAKWNIILRKL